MIHDIPAKSRLVPAIPITSPQFVYRRAKETDVRLTFARAQSGIAEIPKRREQAQPELFRLEEPYRAML